MPTGTKLGRTMHADQVHRDERQGVGRTVRDWSGRTEKARSIDRAFVPRDRMSLRASTDRDVESLAIHGNGEVPIAGSISVIN